MNKILVLCGWISRKNVELLQLNTEDLIPFIKVQKEAKLSHGDRSQSHGYYWYFSSMMGFQSVINVLFFLICVFITRLCLFLKIHEVV